MLSKGHKLDLRKQTAFLKTSRRVATEFFSIFYQKNSSSLLFQVVVSKGVAQSAVERNSIKRSVYDTCARFLPEYGNCPLSIVIMVRRKNSNQWITLLDQKIHQLLEENS